MHVYVYMRCMKMLAKYWGASPRQYFSIGLCNITASRNFVPYTEPACPYHFESYMFEESLLPLSAKTLYSGMWRFDERDSLFFSEAYQVACGNEVGSGQNNKEYSASREIRGHLL